MENTARERLAFIDNIRILLTAVVIFHHLAVTYGAPGGWYYREFEYYQLDTGSLIILVLTAAANQAYFMGFFFFLAGYFSAQSLEKRDAVSFLLQRASRLGIPILLYVYLASPMLRITFQHIMFGSAFSLESIKTIYKWLDFGVELGPMWFVLLLLIFSVLAVPWTRYFLPYIKPIQHPTRPHILSFALVVGIITFLIRTLMPVGAVFQPLNLQVAHLAQYLGLYFAGVSAYKGKWLLAVQGIDSRFWFFLLAGLTLFMPILFILCGGLKGDLTPALGGFHWQSLLYALWEQLFCLAVIITVLYFFQKSCASQTWLAGELSASAYAAYFIHPLVLVTISAGLHESALHPLLKISLLLLPALFLSFLAAGLLRRLPGLRLVF